MKYKLITFLLLFSINVVAVAQKSILTDGLVLHLPFNGDLKDLSGNNNHGIKKGGVSFAEGRFGMEKQSLQFNGINGYIEVPNSSSIETIRKAISINVWINVRQKYMDEFIPVLVNTNTSDKSGSYWLVFRNFKDGWDAYTNNHPIKTPFPFNEWVMFTIISDNSGLRLYQNTKLISERVRKESSTLDIKITGLPILVGAEPYSRWEYLDGKIDDIKVYNKTLEDCEMKLLYNEYSSAPKNRVNYYVSNSISKWKIKDEYETTAEWETRLKNQLSLKTEQFRSEIIKRISSEILWNCGSRTYDADNEEFTLIYNNLEQIKISVPRNEAREFGDNFYRLKYLNAEFKIGDKPNLIIECMTIKNPANGKEYKYGCEPKIEEIPNDVVRVKSKIVTVKIWDDQQEDGDIVSVFLNEARIKKEISVKKSEHIFTIELNEGVNTFKLLAHNEGRNPPNTAAILIDDGNQEYKRVLSSKKDEFAELKIVLE